MYIEDFLRQDSLSGIKQQISIQQNQINKGIKSKQWDVVYSGMEQISKLFCERDETLNKVQELGEADRYRITPSSYTLLLSKLIASRNELESLMIQHKQLKNSLKSIKGW